VDVLVTDGKTGEKSVQPVRLSLIGMAGAGKSFWSSKLAAEGFMWFCCDALIAAKLASELQRPDGTRMELGTWMGFPFEPHYEKREATYLAHEAEVVCEILDYLESPAGDTEENVVVDTTGSVIYTGEEMLRRLCRSTTVVHLTVPPEVAQQMLEAYRAKPGPMLWRGTFERRPGETDEEALARCYPKLFSSRMRLYEHYAEVTVDYYRRMRPDFQATDFITEVARSGRPMRQ
jgi:shikimate kinase